MRGQAVNLIAGLYLRSREGSTKVINGSMAQMQRNKQQKGFTLIELMVTLVVAGILLALGVPSYVDWIRDSRMDTATRSLAGALKQARNEAISKQTVITVGSGITGNLGNWATGFHFYVDDDGAGDAFEADDTLIKNIELSMDNAITVNTNPNNTDYISFTSQGLRNGGGNNTIIIALCDNRGVASGMQIDLSFVGRTSIKNLEDNAGDCSP